MVLYVKFPSGCAKVLIIGAGGVGLWGIQWAKALLPSTTKVFVADISVEKVQGGLDHGADEGILWDRAVSEADLIKLTKEKTGGGIDGSVDFVGMATTSAKAVASINKGATCVVVGLAGGFMSLSLTPLIFADARIEGSLVGDLNQMRDQLRIFQEKNVKATPITLVKPEDTERCLRELQAGTFQGRYVIDWTKE